MAIVDFAQREITVSLVYFGPRRAGSGTNVRQLHRVKPARDKAELRSIAGEDRSERMRHFAYHPAEAPTVRGFDVKVRVASMPSGPGLTLDRNPMLAGVDGVAFVADARADRIEDNLAALLDLERCLARHGLELAAIPLVFQVNHTDADNARPAARIMDELNPFGLPYFASMARQGKGVLETHEALLSATLSRIQDNLAGSQAAMNLTAIPGADRKKSEEAVLSHATALPLGERGPVKSARVPANAVVHVRPPELRESEPVSVLRSELRGGRIHVETVVRRDDGSNRKLELIIEPATETPTPVMGDTGSPPARRGPLSIPGRTGGFATLPHDEEDRDLPTLVYGLGGAVAGFVSGLLLGFLIWG